MPPTNHIVLGATGEPTRNAALALARVPDHAHIAVVDRNGEFDSALVIALELTEAGASAMPFANAPEEVLVESIRDAFGTIDSLVWLPEPNLDPLARVITALHNRKAWSPGATLRIVPPIDEKTLGNIRALLDNKQARKIGLIH